MVVQQVKARVTEAVVPEERNTLSGLFSHASTFRPVDRSRIRGSYLLAVAYSMLVALVVLSIAALVAILSLGLPGAQRAAPSLAIATASLAVVLTVSSLLAAWGNCWLLGSTLTTKDHLIFVSSMTYLPLLIGLHFVSSIAASIASLALLFLNSYYLSACYQGRVNTEDTRSAVIHQVYILVAYLSMTYLCQFSFTAFVS